MAKDDLVDLVTLKVDLVTSDKDLNDSMVLGYEGDIFDHCSYETRRHKIYRFFNLELGKLLKALKDYSFCEYEVTESKNGNLIKVNTLDGTRIK